MFRIKVFFFTGILLLTGGVAFFFESIAAARDTDQVLMAQLQSGRLLVERALKQLVEDDVNRAVELANSEFLQSALASLGEAAEYRPKVFEQVAASITPRLEEWLGKLPPKSKPDWILVLDRQGRVVAQLGSQQQLGDGLASIPLVREMLHGAALDGVWSLEKKTFGVASAAALVAGAPRGGVVMGYQLDESRAATIANMLPRLVGDVQVAVALYDSNRLVGGSVVLDAGTAIPKKADASQFGESELNYGPLPLLVPPLGKYIAAAGPVAGWPTRLQVSVVVPQSMAYAPLAERQLVIGGITLLICLLSLIWGLGIQRDVTRPLKVIVEHLSGVQQGANVGLLPEAALQEPYVRLGKLINMLVSSRGGAARGPISVPSSDISQVLAAAGPAPVEHPDERSDEFEFAGIPGLEKSDAVSASDTSSRASAAGQELSDEETAAAVSEIERLAGESGMAALFGVRSEGPAAAAAQPPDELPSAVMGVIDDEVVPQAPPAVAHAPAPAPELPSMPAVSLPAMSAPPPDNGGFVASSNMQPPAGWAPERTVMVQVPEELLAASAQESSMMTPEATMVAQLDSDLIAASRRPTAGADPDQIHYREVYEQFVNTRRECGESVDDLTYERFEVKLKRNREQLIAKYGCRTVRFQVYVKAGKAALKAVPVRD